MMAAEDTAPPMPQAIDDYYKPLKAGWKKKHDGKYIAIWIIDGVGHHKLFKDEQSAMKYVVSEVSRDSMATTFEVGREDESFVWYFGFVTM